MSTETEEATVQTSLALGSGVWEWTESMVKVHSESKSNVPKKCS